MDIRKPSLFLAAAALFTAQAFAIDQPKQTFAASSESSTVLTTANLAGFIRAAGFDATKLDDHMYKVLAGERLRTVTVQLSTSGYVVYGQILIAHMPTAASFPARLRENIGMRNWETAPAYYMLSECSSCDADQRWQLYLSIAMFNDGMTPSALRKHIGMLVDRLEEDRAFWDIDYTISRR